MLAKIDKTPQLNMYQVPLKQFIKEDHELVVLSGKIGWDYLDNELSKYYCLDNGRPGIPIRKISGILMLKRMFNESDESVLLRWVENPYWQYFCGEVIFQHKLPFDRTELIKFRQRIGEEGAEKILKASIDLYCSKEVKENEVLIDTTVQEKNITYPTDTKLHKRIIERCRKITGEEGIILRQSYQRVLKQLMIDQRFRSHPKRRKKANAAARKIKTIAGRMTRELERGMNLEQKEKYEEILLIFNQILSQERDSKDKIYSIHEPHVKCIAKGKEAKKYEYGNKVSIAKTRRSGIIVGALSFLENVYDGATLKPQLDQIEKVTGGHKPKTGIVDRGYRGRKWVNDTQIVIPGKLPASATNYRKQKIRKQFRARAGIEPIIGHLKHDHRMNRNYLSGYQGDTVNVLLAAAGFNMRKMLLRIRKELKNILSQIINAIFPVRKYCHVFSC
jgi:transposase, IS5 family